MQFDQAFDQGKAEAGSDLAMGAWTALELVENANLVFRSDPDTGIGHGHHHF